MPFDLERGPRIELSARGPRHVPKHQPLDGLIAVLERVSRARDADRGASINPRCFEDLPEVLSQR